MQSTRAQHSFTVIAVVRAFSKLFFFSELCLIQLSVTGRHKHTCKTATTSFIYVQKVSVRDKHLPNRVNREKEKPSVPQTRDGQPTFRTASS